ncbi:hypothetical protein TSTA_003600 [Talaromyces stipitatus ATCC 10500]|uniref:non-specific serine/threonine protein kinase n=1 Tax=Talaromyces stipitatus (strain ATCC 10500 / CBS 375.48 / QM 6759 / NRRL 1006) TaxID=441959 RepID=B8MTH0_TALSN|nr:uncharacterized protein TSTA_003600 [Talaromyces stipitatus ATCC 10500]EED12302.1 hypothetical protein TSTA_003600 [Talaromyces stipitatus ATCC 10500]
MKTNLGIFKGCLQIQPYCKDSEARDVPSDPIVLEDVKSRVIGLTTKYIPGGNLENPDVPFLFEWLKQLTQLVDFLDLELGIMHQDIAPRNLVIDPKTHKLLLFDFYWGFMWGKRSRGWPRRQIPHWDRNIDMVQSMSEWPCNRDLDLHVSTFRNFLNELVAIQNSDGDMERYLNAPKRLTWPDLPTAPDYSVPFESGKSTDGETIWRTGRSAVKTKRN